ncbi:MAG TPA: DUF6221 family protein [Aeromicrobium sp.]|nr:DUF6221 family protein [Aeromicrobium sp.]
MTLSDFLLARIAEDEAGRHEIHRESCDSYRPDANGDTFPCDCDMADRVLAECGAKRKIVEIATDQIRLGREARGWGNWEDMAYQTLRALALPYADHPDFDEEWRP